MRTETAIMKPKHTPGPWALSDAGPNSGNIIRMEICGPDAHKVCEIEDSTIDAAKTMKRKAAQRDEANARLIQSAPDLLEAIQDLLNADIYADGEGLVSISSTDTDTGEKAVKKARAAIAKALGK